MPDLRKSIRNKFRIVEFDDRADWITDDEQGPVPTNTAADTGEKEDADDDLDARVASLQKG